MEQNSNGNGKFWLNTKRIVWIAGIVVSILLFCASQLEKKLDKELFMQYLADQKASMTKMEDRTSSIDTKLGSMDKRLYQIELTHEIRMK